MFKLCICLSETKKIGTVFLYLIFYSLIFEGNIVIYLGFVIIFGNRLKYITVTAKRLQ